MKQINSYVKTYFSKNLFKKEYKNKTYGEDPYHYFSGKGNIIFLKLSCENQILHRHNGPAYITKTGHKEWFLNGVYHRKNGPCIETSNNIGNMFSWYNKKSEWVSEEHYWNQ